LFSKKLSTPADRPISLVDLESAADGREAAALAAKAPQAARAVQAVLPARAVKVPLAARVALLPDKAALEGEAPSR